MANRLELRERAQKLPKRPTGFSLKKNEEGETDSVLITYDDGSQEERSIKPSRIPVDKLQ
jgi:hypothetical protein